MFLTLEDLVPNALIELMENGSDRAISYSLLLQYGNCVIEELRKKGISTTMVVYRDNVIQFEDEYREIFDFFEMDGIRYIRLKENVDTQYLRKYFRVLQSADSLVAMTSNNAKQVLGIVAEKTYQKSKFCNNFVSGDFIMHYFKYIVRS